MIKYYSIAVSICVSAIVIGLVVFVTINAFPIEWRGLINPILGTVRLLLLSCLIAAPMGLSLGVYLSEYAGKRMRNALITVLESLGGIPSIAVGFFGFILILFVRKLIPAANTSLLLSAFCLSILVLPALALNTYTALQAVSQDLRVTGAAVGLSKETIIARLLIPQAGKGLASGLLLAAGRCAEDTAVILMTGAVASTGLGAGIFNKFEALPFFIYYTSANYQDSAQLSQVFTASLLLLIITPALILAGTIIKEGKDRWT